ncbi:hypothetical protein Y032_0167g146 [Ancylostoma ceylanicum]|uniref:Uncharacterized protein n=1 Tax=Ancylostoma ceylanicum TaxID=53326 RepID=A0A016SWN3_9BILA|nr:hypothetical protein Y032_0167g146 [Ancylostoma ceylanicum]
MEWTPSTRIRNDTRIYHLRKTRPSCGRMRNSAFISHLPGCFTLFHHCLGVHRTLKTSKFSGISKERRKKKE